MTLALILLGVGLLLLFADVWFPSFGALSLLGVASLLWSVGAAFGEGRDTGFVFLAAVAVLVPTVILLGLKLFPNSPVGRRVVSSGLSFESTAATDPRDLTLLGKLGQTSSDLRPAGYARIEGRRVDVVSRGEPIPEGTAIRVLEVVGNRVVVAAVEAPTPDGVQTRP